MTIGEGPSLTKAEPEGLASAGGKGGATRPPAEAPKTPRQRAAPATPPPERRWYRTRDISRLTGRSPMALAQLLGRGRMPAPDGRDYRGRWWYGARIEPWIEAMRTFDRAEALLATATERAAPPQENGP